MQINYFTREFIKKIYFYFLFTKLQLHNISLVSTFIQRFTILFLFNRSSRMQKRTAWPRADYLINKPRFKRIGELINSWTRVGLKRVGKSDDRILCLIAKRTWSRTVVLNLGITQIQPHRVWHVDSSSYRALASWHTCRQAKRPKK